MPAFQTLCEKVEEYPATFTICTSVIWLYDQGQITESSSHTI